MMIVNLTDRETLYLQGLLFAALEQLEEFGKNFKFYDNSFLFVEVSCREKDFNQTVYEKLKNAVYFDADVLETSDIRELLNRALNDAVDCQAGEV